MKGKILAAIETGPAAGPVLATARAIAKLYDGNVETVNARESDDLLSIAQGEEVVAVVLGARAVPLGKEPMGRVSTDLITSLRKPVVVVPAHASGIEQIKRVLIPLEGTRSSAAALTGVIERARAHGLEIVLLHVRDERSVPRFSEQPHHEMDAWADEFLARYCSCSPRDVRFEVRVGSASEEIVRAVEQLGSHLLALGWSQILAENRAQVVRRCLDQSPVPVLLVPTEERERRVE